MDDTDFRLLSLLHRDALQSHAALGRTLAISAQAVTKRLDRLAEQDVLRGFFALPEPEAFRRQGHVLVFRGGDWSCDVAQQALGAEDVVWVAEKHDGDLTVQVYRAFDRSGGAAAPLPDAVPPDLVELLGRPPEGCFGTEPPTLWPTLSRLDLRILQAMVDDPRQSAERLAERAGLGIKTARKVRAQLLDAGLVTVRPDLGPLPGGGVLLFHLGVYSEPHAPLAAKQVQATLPDAVEVNRLDAPPAVYLFCRAPDLPAVFAAQAAFEALPGVRDVRLSLNRDFHVAEKRLRGWLQAALRDAPGPA